MTWARRSCVLHSASVERMILPPKQNYHYSSYPFHVEDSLLKGALNIKTLHKVLNLNLQVSLEVFGPRQLAKCYKNGHRWCYQESAAHLLLLILSILQPQHEIFHFFSLLPLPHISRKLHISRPDVHLVQPLISKKLLWLASWYNTFYALFLVSGTPGSAQCWKSDSLRHCFWFERKEQWQPCEKIVSLSSVMCSPQREEACFLRQYKANDCYCLALFNRKYTIRFLCSILYSH